MNFLVYLLSDPRYAFDDARQLFYVGACQRGIVTRMKAHMRLDSNDRNPRRTAWFRELQTAELLPSVTILAKLPEPPKGADKFERYPFQFALGVQEMLWIKQSREEFGSRLLNRSNGGENIVGPMSGRRHSKETILRMCRAQGSDEAREANRLRNSTPEAVAKIRAVHIGRTYGPETLAKRSAAQLARGTRDHVRGEEHPRAVLTAEIVSDCRALHSADPKKFGYRALGRKFGVDHKTVRRAVLGQTWKEVTS